MKADRVFLIGLALAVLVALIALACAPARADILYLSGLPPVNVVSDSDTTFWCDTASGCGAGISLKRITAPQIANYAASKLSATAPLFLSGNNFQLLIDNTLSIVGNQLHVVGGGGGGGGITQLVGPVTAGPGSGVQTSAIAPSGVTAGTYTCPTTTVNIEGRITSLVSGSCGGGSGVTTTRTVSDGSSLSCWTLTSGSVTAIASGACGGGGGGVAVLVDTTVAILVSPGVALLVQ